jgi:hypothetical protein
MDLDPLSVAPKVTPPQAEQLPNESLRFWSGVTDAITSKQFSKATTIKQEIEEKQREKAKARETLGKEWTPRFFTGAVTPLGKPELTEEGILTLKGIAEGNWELAEAEETAA